tara:strand:- start:1361 stop:1966 length:606 start_codon:yes stop_codon:yes gene_type:complete
MGSTVNTDQPAYIDNGVLTDGEAWVALQTNTVTGAAVSSVTLTSSTGVNNWSQYQDLVAVWYAQSDEASANYDTFRCRINNDSTAATYNGQNAYHYGTTMAVGQWSSAEFWIGDVCSAANNSGNDFGTSINYFYDINAGKYTQCQTQYCGTNDTNNNFDGQIIASYLKTDQVTSLVFYFDGDDINVGSRVDLFGVLPRMVS